VLSTGHGARGGRSDLIFDLCVSGFGSFRRWLANCACAEGQTSRRETRWVIATERQSAKHARQRGHRPAQKRWREIRTASGERGERAAAGKRKTAVFVLLLQRARSLCVRSHSAPLRPHAYAERRRRARSLLSLDLRSSRDLAELAGASPSLPLRPSVPRLRERLGKDISGRFARCWLCTCLLPLGELLLLLLPAIDHEWCCVLC